jgi:hypothetical protein
MSFYPQAACCGIAIAVKSDIDDETRRFVTLGALMRMNSEHEQADDRPTVAFSEVLVGSVLPEQPIQQILDGVAILAVIAREIDGCAIGDVLEGYCGKWPPAWMDDGDMALAQWDGDRTYSGEVKFVTVLLLAFKMVGGVPPNLPEVLKQISRDAEERLGDVLFAFQLSRYLASVTAESVDLSMLEWDICTVCWDMAMKMLEHAVCRHRDPHILGFLFDTLYNLSIRDRSLIAGLCDSSLRNTLAGAAVKIIDEAVKWAEGGAMCLLAEMMVTSNQNFLGSCTLVRMLAYLGSGMDPKCRVLRAVLPRLMQYWNGCLEDCNVEIRAWLKQVIEPLGESVIRWEELHLQIGEDLGHQILELLADWSEFVDRLVHYVTEATEGLEVSGW